MVKFGPLVCLIFVIVLSFTFITPYQLINEDSVVGFSALKGHDWTGKFNTFFFYDQTHNRLYERFLTWWSPGQFVMPGLFMRLFGLSLGHAITLVNSLCMLFGTIGYAVVFRRYKFPPAAVLVSILLILFSGSLLYRYYSYQGGESLNYLLFPWIIVGQDILFKKYLAFLLPGLVVLLGFFFKLQMLVFVPPLLLLLNLSRGDQLDRLIEPATDRKSRAKIGIQMIKRSLPVLISIAFAIALVYKGFMARGATPASLSQVTNYSWLNLLVPLASPITSFYVGEAGFNFFHTDAKQELYLAVCCLPLLLLLFFIIRDFPRMTPLRKKYTLMVLALFLMAVPVFAFLYIKGSVDFNTRHFKLTSFLFYPLFFESLYARMNRKMVAALAAVLILFASGNHLRLSRTWLKTAPITTTGFRLGDRADMPMGMKTMLDANIRRRTIVVSPYDPRYSIDNRLILPVYKPLDGDRYPALPHQLDYPILYIDSTFSMYKQ